MYVFWASIETHMRKGSRLHPVFPSVCQARQTMETTVFPLRVSLLRGWGWGVSRMMLAQEKEGKTPVWGDNAHLLEGSTREGHTFRKSPPTLLLALCSLGPLRKQLDTEASLISQRLQLKRSRVGPRGGVSTA